MGMRVDSCKMFILCENVATVYVAHPILKRVASCEHCAAKMQRLTKKEN